MKISSLKTIFIIIVSIRIAFHDWFTKPDPNSIFNQFDEVLILLFCLGGSVLVAGLLIYFIKSIKLKSKTDKENN